MGPLNIDRGVLNAAREVFLRDPRATMAAVAREAGMGVGGIYRRYANKQALLSALSADNHRRYIAYAEAALADSDDPWDGFTGFLRNVLDEGVHRLAAAITGLVEPDEMLDDLDRQAVDLTNRLLRAARGSGVLRPDVTRNDIVLILEQLGKLDVGDPVRSAALRRRHLVMICDGLRAQSSSRRLPAPAPRDDEVAGFAGRTPAVESA